MKRKLPLLFLLLLYLTGFSQTIIPNADFENWQNIGSTTEEPNNWSSNKTGSGFATNFPQTCFRENTNPQNGTYCLRIETISYFGSPINGKATTGRVSAPTTNQADAYFQTVASNSNYNAPFTGRPDNFLGYFKNTFVGGNSGKIKFILHGNYDVKDPADAGSTPYIIGTAEFTIPTSSTSTWTSFDAPISYISTETPAYVLIIADSGNTVGNKLWIDNLSLNYNLNSESFEDSTSSILYPNPSNGNFTIDLKNKNNTSISVFDISGKLIFSESNINDLNYTLKLNLETGIYTVKIDSGGKIENHKLIIE